MDTKPTTPPPASSYLQLWPAWLLGSDARRQALGIVTTLPEDRLADVLPVLQRASSNPQGAPNGNET